MRKTTKILMGAAAAALLAGCGHGDSWTVDGTIEGAGENRELILEASSNGRWYPLDTVVLGRSGNFSFTQKAAGYPDIYRLRLDGRSLYFPIDSVETVTVVAKADAFDTGYTITGSADAERLMAVDRKLLEAASRLGADGAVNDSLLKRELAGDLLADPAGIVAYYIINKQLGGVNLFNPADKRDLRVIGAVANAFSERRPDDPRTAYLANLYTGSYARLVPRTPSASPDTITAETLGVLDISLYDDNGRLQSLSELAAGGHPVILNFTVYGAEASPAINVALNKVYEKYHPQGLEIYQVAVDDDEYQWRQSARNLPWITVYNSTHDGPGYLMRYNVTSLPATFIIGRDGEIKKRVDDLSTLATDITPYI